MKYDVRYKYKGEIWSTDRFMKNNRVAGLIVLKDGKVALERYAMGLTSTDRWESFSVTKSITSTLIGAAIEDGSIKSLDDDVTDYIPELKGSAYEGVTIRDLITMTSGVKWREVYTDPDSDVAQFSQLIYGVGTKPELRYLARLPRAHKPGTVFNYNTGEMSLAGFLVGRATGEHLADYLSEKIWTKIGAGRDAVWMIDRRGEEIGGCCISMTLRDYGPLRPVHSRRRQRRVAERLGRRRHAQTHRQRQRQTRLRLHVVDLAERHLRRPRLLRPDDLHRPKNMTS